MHRPCMGMVKDTYMHRPCMGMVKDTCMHRPGCGHDEGHLHAYEHGEGHLCA